MGEIARAYFRIGNKKVGCDIIETNRIDYIVKYRLEKTFAVLKDGIWTETQTQEEAEKIYKGESL